MDELGSFQIELRLKDVEADDVIDLGVRFEPCGEPGGEVAGDARDQDPLTHSREPTCHAQHEA